MRFYPAHSGRIPPRGARPLTTSPGYGSAATPVGRGIRIVCVAGLFAVGAATAACGGGSGEGAAEQPSKAAAVTSGPHGMASMDMGDPSATPAYEVAGAKVQKGSLKLLDTRPPGTDNAKGTAWLAQGAKGTTVTVSMTGLKPGVVYIAHLHSKHCSDDNGGPHFRFEANGPAMPPNEVHLLFTADSAGKGLTTVNNARKIGDGAVALVVHPRDAQDNGLACADF